MGTFRLCLEHGLYNRYECLRENREFERKCFRLCLERGLHAVYENVKKMKNLKENVGGYQNSLLCLEVEEIFRGKERRNTRMTPTCTNSLGVSFSTCLSKNNEILIIHLISNILSKFISHELSPIQKHKENKNFPLRLIKFQTNSYGLGPFGT